jgi:hypothetical protein
MAVVGPFLNNAQEGPIELWGIEMAIDGAMARVTWEPEDSSNCNPNQPVSSPTRR